MHLAWKVLQKSTFAEIGFLMIPGPIFHDFLVTLGPIFMIFDALETGLGDSGVTPDPGNPPGLG